MIKRKILLLNTFSIMLFFSILSFLPVVKGYNYMFTDIENDVIRECNSEVDTGDYNDEIDIVKITIAGKNINLTVAGDLGYWNNSHVARIHFSNRFIPKNSTDFAWTPPCYVIECEKDYGGFEATLERAYSLGGGNFAYEVWNGTAWEDRITATPANIFTSVSEHSIIIDIPAAVEPIPNDMKVLFWTRYYFSSSCKYHDFAPSLSSFQEEGIIPSYNLFILIFTMIGSSLIMIKITKNRKSNT
ncbi:MAG: hypothetical protein ACFE8M_04460 [Candidatus Hermodarchaeota archaeon]